MARNWRNVAIQWASYILGFALSYTILVNVIRYFGNNPASLSWFLFVIASSVITANFFMEIVKRRQAESEAEHVAEGNGIEVPEDPNHDNWR